jgi:hypothetical protein
VVDVFDATALAHAVALARPDVVIHQFTDLPKDLDPRQMGAAIIRTARILGEGTRKVSAQEPDFFTAPDTDDCLKSAQWQLSTIDLPATNPSYGFDVAETDSKKKRGGAGG